MPRANVYPTAGKIKRFVVALNPIVAAIPRHSLRSPDIQLYSGRIITPTRLEIVIIS